MARLIDRAMGFVHDIDHLSALSDDPCNIRVLSDRALYILQNLATKDVAFLARYGEILSGGLYEPVKPNTANENLVQTTQDLIRQELQDMSLEQGLEAIADAITTLALNQCCEDEGSGGAGSGEAPATEDQDNGTTSPDTEEWPDYSDYREAKCNRAAYVLNQITEDVNRLETANWVGLLSLPLGEALLALAALLVTPIPGDEILGLLAVLTTISGGILPVVGIVKDAINDVEGDLLCDLFQATDVAEAKTNARATLLAEIDAQSSGITQAAASLMGQMFFTNNSLNPLFDPDYPFTAPTADCSDCGPVEVTLSFVDIGGTPAGSGDLTPDGSVRTLTATEFAGAGVSRLQFAIDQADANCNIEIVSVSAPGVTTWPTCRLRCANSGTDVWNHDSGGDDLGPAAENGNAHQGADFKANGQPETSWTMDVIIGTPFTGPC